MNFSPDEVEAAIEKMRKICRGIRAMPMKHAEAMISKTVTETIVTNKSIEDRIAEAGCIPGDIAAIFMHYGAVVAIIEDLPLTNDRRELVAAGRELGKMIAAKFGEMVREQLSAPKGKHN